jgi:hypothetical protein
MPSDILNSHNLHILDFGGADGSLSIEFAKSFKSTQNIFITIVDFGSNIGGCSNPNISIRKVHDIPKDVTFDLIIASATIEMLPETGEIISRLMNLLKSAGSVLFIRTNYIIPFKRFFPFIDFAFPAHLHDIGPQFWRNFARTESANIKIIRSEPSISELNFLDFPFRWAVSTFFKLPGRIEARIFPNNLYRFWRFVGAWEVVILKINS